MHINSEGINTLFNAINFDFDKDIHNATTAQAKVLNIKGTTIDSPAEPGIINTSKHIDKYDTNNPPKIEQIALNKPILLPVSSSNDSFMYVLINKSNNFNLILNFENYNHLILSRYLKHYKS